MQKYIFILIFLVFVLVRLVNLPQSFNLGSDDGRDFLAVWDIFTMKDLTLLGPPSQYAIDGYQFYFGPAPYYLIIPALLIGNWDPLYVSYFMILLNAVVLVLSVYLLHRDTKHKQILLIFLIGYTLFPYIIQISRFYWNPHFMLPISTLLLSLLVVNTHKKNTSFNFYIFLGFLFGLGFQFHYSFIFAIVISTLCLFITKSLNYQRFLTLIGGAILGFLPIIVYELLNNFYNLRIFSSVFTNSGEVDTPFAFHPFYFISLIPFLLYGYSFLMTQVIKKYPRFIYSIVILFIILSLSKLLIIPEHTLPYPTLQKIAEEIGNDKPLEYNIVDQLTKDNRAMALRYLLTVKGIKPLGVTEYPQAKILYIYSKRPLEILLKDPVWEIQSFEPYYNQELINTIDGVTIYKITK